MHQRRDEIGDTRNQILIPKLLRESAGAGS